MRKSPPWRTVQKHSFGWVWTISKQMFEKTAVITISQQGNVSKIGGNSIDTNARRIVCSRILFKRTLNDGNYYER